MKRMGLRTQHDSLGRMPGYGVVEKGRFRFVLCPAKGQSFGIDLRLFGNKEEK